MKEFPIYQICRRSFPDKNADWRDARSYTSTWTDEEVAFEFLRRNQGYWTFIKQFYQLPDDSTEWPSGRLENYVRSNLSQNQYDELREHAAKEFGLWKCCDPRLPIAGESSPWTVAASITARYQYAAQKAYEHGHMEYRFGRHSPTDTITIDLLADASVEAQVEFVRWVLNRVRASMGLNHRAAPRFQPKLFGDYLRLLDGRNDGASLLTIAQCIYHGRKGNTVDLVRKRLKTATALRDGAYRDLLLWSGKIELPQWLQSIPDELDELSAELWDLAGRGDSDGFNEVWAEFTQKLAERNTLASPRWSKRSTN